METKMSKRKGEKHDCSCVCLDFVFNCRQYWRQGSCFTSRSSGRESRWKNGTCNCVSNLCISVDSIHLASLDRNVIYQAYFCLRKEVMFIRRCAAPPFLRQKSNGCKQRCCSEEKFKGQRDAHNIFNIFVISDARFCILFLTMLFKKIKPRLSGKGVCFYEKGN